MERHGSQKSLGEKREKGLMVGRRKKTWEIQEEQLNMGGGKQGVDLD